MRLIRQQTDDGAELVDFILKVFRGQLVGKLRPSLNQRIAAATWLAARGFGRPTQQADDVPDRPPFLFVLRHPPGAHDPLAQKSRSLAQKRRMLEPPGEEEGRSDGDRGGERKRYFRGIHPPPDKEPW